MCFKTLNIPITKSRSSSLITMMTRLAMALLVAVWGEAAVAQHNTAESAQRGARELIDLFLTACVSTNAERAGLVKQA